MANQLVPPSSMSLEESPKETIHLPVSHLLVAEFDIDKGSVLRHTYPRELGMASSALAEAMLPEGAHLRYSPLVSQVDSALTPNTQIPSNKNN